MEASESEQALIRSARSGNRTAYAELARRWYRPVLAMCRVRLALAQDAEDAAQETFVRGFLHIGELREATRFVAWLRGIAGHVCVDMLRTKLRSGAHCLSSKLDLVDGAGPDAAELVESQEDRDEVWRAVQGLAEPYREVVLLHYFGTLTYDEMAQWLGVARATVQERLSKARHELRRHLLRRWRTHRDL